MARGSAQYHEEYVPPKGDTMGSNRSSAVKNATNPSRSAEDEARLAGIVRRAHGTKADEMAPGVQAEAQKRFAAEQARTAGREDFSAMTDINVEAEADEMNPIKIEGVAPTKAKVTGVDRDKAMAQSAPTFGTQYNMEGGKVRFSPKGDLYVYEYDPKTREYTIVDGPGGVGAKFGADHPSIAKFDESRMAAQQESGVTPPEELAIEGDAGADPDSLTPAEFRERYGSSREEAEPSLDESVFAPSGARSKMAPVGPVSTAEAEDPEMRTMRAQEARRTDPQSPALREILFEGPQPIVDKEGVLYTNNVRNALMTGELDIDEWPKIKQRLEEEGAIKTQIGADPTQDPAFRSRILAAQAASRAMRLQGYRG